MLYKELITQISEELSIPKKTIRNVLDSYLNTIKNSIANEEDNKILFTSPILSVKNRIIPKDEEKNLPERKRGIIIVKKD